jgi:hypothetical protein
MNTIVAVTLLSVFAGVDTFAQLPGGAHGTVAPEALPLEQKVRTLEIRDATLPHAVATMSRSSAGRLHLGTEEIIGEGYSDPIPRGVRFSLHLEDKSVRETLDALCGLDSRYTWSTDGASVNIYPRATTDDPAYLLNLQIERITLTDAADPYAALDALHRQHPEQQVGYAQIGGDPSFAQPWTVTFEHLTVRQLLNRVAEHMGPQSFWTWHGIKGERMFNFFKGSYHTPGQ